MKYLRRILVAIPAALAVLLFLLYALRGVIIEPRLKAFISSSAESALGLRIEIGDIRGSYLASLELKDVRTVREGEPGPVMSIEAEKIRARYSLLSLLSGLEAFLGRLRVDIDGARVGLDLRGGGGEEEPDDPEGGPLALPAVLPEVSIRDSSVTLKGSGFGVRAGGIRFFVKPGPGKNTSGIDVGVAEFDLDHPAVREGAVSLGASLLYDGSGITIEGVDVEQEEVVRSGRVDLSGLPDVFSAEAQSALFGRRLDVRCTLEGSRIEANLTAGETDLGELFSVILLPAVELDGTLSAEAEVLVDTKNLPGLEGSLSVDWKNARFDAFSADLLEGRASAHEGLLTVESLKGRSEENVADLSGLALSLDALFGGEWNLLVDSLAGAFSLHLADLPGLLSQGDLSIPGMKGDAPPHRIDLEGKIGERTLSFSEGKLEVAGGRIELSPSALSLPGAGEGWEEAALDVELVADLPDLSVLNELFPLPALSGALEGVVSLHGSFGAPSGKVEVEAAALAFGERPVGDLVLKGEGDGRLLTVRSAQYHAAGEAGDVEVRELTLPAMELFAGEWKGLLQELTGSLRVKSSNLPALLGALGQDFPGGGVPPHTLGIQGEAGGGRIAISQGVFESEPGGLTIEKGEVSFPRPGMEWSETALDLDMRTDVPDLGRAGEIFGVSGLGGAITGGLTLSGSLSTLHGAASIEGSALSFGELPPGNLTLEAEADRDTVRITSLEMAREEDLLTASGSFDLSDRAFSDVIAEVSVDDLSDYGLEPESLTGGTAIRGSLGIGGTLEALEGKVQVSAVSPEGSLSLSGDVQAKPGEDFYALLLGELELARGEAALALAGPADFSLSPSEGLAVKDFSLAGEVGTFRIDGTVTPAGEGVLLLDVSGFTGREWLEEFVGDRFVFSGADLKVEASGPLRTPELSVTGRVGEFRGRGAPGPAVLEFDARYSPVGVTIGKFTLSGDGGGSVEMEGRIPWDPLADEPLLDGEIGLTADLGVPDLTSFAFLLPPGYGVDGSLEGNVSLSGSWERPTGEVELKARDLGFPEALRPSPPGPLSVDCAVDAVRGEFTLRELRVDSPALKMSATGAWRKAPVLIEVIRGEEELLQGEVDLEGSIDSDEIGWVARGLDFLRSAEGGVEGTFSLKGPVSAPRIRAEAVFDELGLRLKGAPPASDVNGRITFDEGTLRFPSIEGDLGGAPFELGGAVSGIGGGDPDIDVRLKGDGLLLYRDEGIRVRADADISARGPLTKLEIGGSVMLTESRYVKNIDLFGSVGGHKAPKVEGKGFLFSFRDPPLRDLRFDLRVGANDPFLIRNQFIRASISPDLRLRGTGEEPALVGQVNIDSYRAQLPTGVMKGERGIVAFLEREPGPPWLEVRGDSRMMGYDITMQVTEFADDPKVIFSSSPPLPGDEILLMVLAGTPPRSADKDVAASTGAALSVFLARSFLGQWFGGSGDETEESILERLETEVGRDITESGDPTIDSRLRLRENMLWPGGTLYMTSGRDRYDDFNYGFRFTIDIGNGGEQ